QKDEGKEADRDTEQEEANLLLREEVRWAPGENDEPHGGQRGARGHPDDLRAVEGVHRRGSVAARLSEVHGGCRDQGHRRRDEGEPGGRAPHPSRKRENEREQEGREESPGGVLEEHGRA